ncbi:unnamed protein product [Paramecium sonneborni]|uniref:GRIP domain-containing protein n=1 Tax=Paramecium sonneborni TaxID=65129 RepID=A0A8S1PG32_9CILI|nr:unnamed protein product [Paramecium sonneborni]
MQKLSRQNTQTAFYSPQPGICSPQPLRQIISPGIYGPRNSQNFLIDSYTTKHQDQDSDRLLGSSLRFNMLKDCHQQIEKEISVLKSNLLQSRMSGDNFQFSQQPLDKLLKPMFDKGTHKTEQIRADDLLTEILQELSIISTNAKKLQNQQSSQKLQMLLIKDIREIIMGYNAINQICQTAQISINQLQNINIPQLLKKEELNKLYSLVEKHQKIYPQSFDQLYQIIACSLQSKEQDHNKLIEINTQLRQYESQNKDLNIKNKNLFAVITKLEAKVNKLENKKQQLEFTNKQFSNQLHNSHRASENYQDNDKFKSKNGLIESQSSLDSKNNQNKLLETQLNQFQDHIVEKETEIMNLKQQIEEQNQIIQNHQKKVKQLENENKLLKLQISKVLESEKLLQKQKLEVNSEYQNYKDDSSQKLKSLSQEIVDLKQKSNKNSSIDRSLEVEQLNQQISKLKTEKEDKERENNQTQLKLQEIKQKYNDLKQSFQELSDQYQHDQQMNKQIVQSLQTQKEDFENRNSEQQSLFQLDMVSQQEIETQQQLIKQLENDLQQAQFAFKQQENKLLNYEDEINNLKAQIKRLELEHTEQLHILDNTIQSKDQIIQQYESNSRILNDTPEQLRSKSMEQTTIQGHLKSQIDTLNRSLSNFEQQIRDLTKVNNQYQDQINAKDKIIKNKNQEINQLQQQLKEFQGINQKIQVQERTIHHHEKQISNLNQTIQKLQESLNFKDQIILGKQHEIEMLQNQKKDYAQQQKQQTLLFEQQHQKAKLEQQELQNKIKKLEDQIFAKQKDEITLTEQQKIYLNQIQQLELQIKKLKQDYEDEKKQFIEKIQKLIQELEEAEKLQNQSNEKQILFENTQSRLIIMENELISAQDQIQQLESRIQDLQNDIKIERQSFLKENQLKIDELNSQYQENEELVAINQDLTQKNIQLSNEIQILQQSQINIQSQYQQEIEKFRNTENNNKQIIKKQELQIEELNLQIELFKQSQKDANLEKVKLSEMINEQLKTITDLNNQLQINIQKNDQQIEETKAQYSSELVIREAELISKVMKQTGEIQKLLFQIGVLIEELEKNKQTIDKLEIKIAESEQKYQILNQQLKVLESQSQQQIQSQIEKQSQQVQQQEFKISNLQNELNEKTIELQTLLLQNQIQEQDINNSQVQIENLNQQLKHEQQENQDQNLKCQNLNQELLNNKQQNQDLQNRITELEQNQLAKESKINELQQLLSQEQGKCSNLINEIKEKSDQIDQQTIEIKQIKNDNNHLKDLKINLEKNLEAKEIIITNNIDIINGLDLNIKNKNQELIEKENKYQNQMKEIEKCTNKIQQLQSQITIFESQIQERTQYTQLIQKELNLQQHQNQELEQSNKKLQLQINQLTQNFNQLNKEHQELLEKTNALKNEILELEKNNKELVENQVQITNKIEADQAQNRLIVSLQEQINHLQQTIQQLENDLKGKQNQIMLSIQESQAQEQKLLQQNNQLVQDHDEQIAQQKIDYEKVKQQNNQLSLQTDFQQQDIKQLKLELQQEIENRQQINNQKIELNNQLVHLNQKLLQKEQQNQQLDQQLKDAETLLLKEQKKLNQQIENLNSQISALRRQVDEMKKTLIIKDIDIAGYSKREIEAMKLFDYKDAEILTLQNEIEFLKDQENSIQNKKDNESTKQSSQKDPEILTLQRELEMIKNQQIIKENQLIKQIEEKNTEILELKCEIEKFQNDVLKRENQNNVNEINGLLDKKDSEIIALKNEIEVQIVQMNKIQASQIQSSSILNEIKALFNQENILDYLRQFKSQHEKQCERKFIYYQCLQSLMDEYLRNQPAAFYAQNYLKLTQQEQNNLLAYQKDIQLMKAKLPIKTALSNIKEQNNEDLSLPSNEDQPEINQNDISGFIEDLEISAIVNNDKNKKENSNYNKQLSHTEEVNILKCKLEAANEENVKIIAKFQILLERIAAKEEQMVQLNNLARDYKHKMMAMQKTSVDPQAVHAKAHLRDCLKKFLTACGPKTQKFDLAEAILITLFQFLEFSEKEKEEILDELALKPADKKKGIVQILFKK